MIDKPITREELISVIEGKGATYRVPSLFHFWVFPDEFGDRKQQVDNILDMYPMDAQIIKLNMPEIFNAPKDDPEYRWVNYDDPNPGENVGLDEKVAIKDWDVFDDIIRDFPNPEYVGLIPECPPQDGRYRMSVVWNCFYERHWKLRGMTNALMDFYIYPDRVHQLYEKLTNFYCRVMERAKDELNIDGFFISDDIGTQNAPFFPEQIFIDFLKPYYKRVIEKAHSLGMHFWLHSCGNIEMYLPHFIEIDLDVIHPIQKHTMDEKWINDKYGKDICIWAGFDVQQIIPWGTPEEVREEVRYLIDTYYKKEGRLILTAGNGVNGDCKVESLKALLDETLVYGSSKN